MSRLIAIAISLSLAACGLKGPLVLPPGPVPEPLLGNASTPGKSTADVSTDPKATRP